MTQADISALIANTARQGKRVVRLKGGDPGLFGRLAEEVDALDRLALPYRVRAGVSALTVATTGTGMLLTRRGVSRGFTAMTPRMAEGGMAGAGAEARGQLPLVLFMSVAVASEMARQLMSEAWDALTPVAIVFNAGAEDEQVLRLTLGALADTAITPSDAPGLVIIGAAAATSYRRDTGALRGCRVLLTCSEALLEKAALRVIDFGGVPLSRPMIRLVPCVSGNGILAVGSEYDWVVLTSPSAVQVFMETAQQTGIDFRHIPKIMTCGPGSSAMMRRFGIVPDLTPPMDYSAEGLADVLDGMDFGGQRVLRLRSEKAGALLAEVLRQKGADVDDVKLYENQPIHYATLPPFDAVFFASASAVEAFAEQFGADALDGKTVVAIGKPTAAALRTLNRPPDITSPTATVDGAIEALAQQMTLQ